jgi:polysaccharide chain length determinant protein (PEP-CTERM system associated)
MSFDLKFYLSRFLRRFHYFVLVALAVSALGITVAYMLPPVYQAKATLFVESPQIPNDLAASTVQAGQTEILTMIQQRLDTRANILDMSQRLGIYGPNSTLTPDQIVADIRSRLDITLPAAGGRGGRGSSANMTVFFSAPTGEMSAKVTNDIVTQILQESVALRTSATGQTLDFFNTEVQRLSEDLARQSEKILQFKLANKDALPDSLDYRRAQQGSLQQRMLQIERELSSLTDRRAKLIDLYQRTGQVGTDPSAAPRSPEEKRLQDLRRELESALVVYTPQNPRVRVLQAQIAALEKTVAAQAGVTDPQQTLSPFDLQMADLDAQIAHLNDEKARIEADLRDLKTSIDATPANAIQIDVLQRDYNAIQARYNQAVSSQSQAALGDRIESLSKGQRVTVIEQAVVPQEPSSPPRVAIAAGSVGGGVALGGALVFLLEFLNRSIQRPAEVANRLGIATFSTIPYIRTDRQARSRRGIIIAAMLLALVGIPAMLYAIHFYYMPIDLLISRLLDRVGLSLMIGEQGQSAG